MKKLAALALLAVSLTPAAPAACAYCYRGPCYNHSICGAGCLCVKRRPYDLSGFCASLQSSPED